MMFLIVGLFSYSIGLKTAYFVIESDTERCFHRPLEATLRRVFGFARARPDYESHVPQIPCSYGNTTYRTKDLSVSE